MRYLVHLNGKEKILYFWEENKTHTTFANEKAINLDKISSVGYVLYNPDIQKWILTGAVSWAGDANVEEDKRRVLRYIKKHFSNDSALKERLSAHWYQTQQKNAQIVKEYPFFARFFKTQGKERQ